MDSKLSLTPEQLCENLPWEFGKLLTYARELEFEEKPDYKTIRQMFKNYLDNNNLKLDYIYDWDNINNEENKKEDKNEDNKNKDKNEDKDE